MYNRDLVLWTEHQAPPPFPIPRLAFRVLVAPANVPVLRVWSINNPITTALPGLRWYHRHLFN